MGVMKKQEERLEKQAEILEDIKQMTETTK